MSPVAVAFLHGYSQEPMPNAAPLGEGPWGDAVKYWLRKKRLSQTELAKGTGLTDNTISTVVRGFPTKTSSLRLIADFLKVPIEAVLVSPLRHVTGETKRQLMREAVDRALRSMENLDEATIDAARELQGLTGEFRQTALTAIANMKEAQRAKLDQQRKARPPRKKR